MLTDVPNLHSSIGYGFGAGAGYEFRVNKFMVHTGAEFVNLHPNLSLDDFVHHAKMIDNDTQITEYTGHFKFSDNSDRYNLGYVNIPLMFGVDFGRFYFLAGGKVGLNMFSESNVKTTVKSTATYDPFIVDFENMPNHFFTTTEENTNYPIAFDMNISAAFEMGFNFGASDKNNTYYRLAYFCDYGLATIYTGSQTQNLLVSKHSDHFQPALNNFLMSNQTEAAALYTGVKLTVVLGTKKPPICKCEEYTKPVSRKKPKKLR